MQVDKLALIDSRKVVGIKVVSLCSHWFRFFVTTANVALPFATSEEVSTSIYRYIVN